MSNSAESQPELDKLAKEVSCWRRVRERPGRMPVELWERATELAKQLGLRKVAQSLGLNQTTLRNRMEAMEKPGMLATFVELLPSPSTGSPHEQIGECALEVDSADGLRLRVILKGLSTGSLTGILRLFAKGS